MSKKCFYCGKEYMNEYTLEFTFGYGSSYDGDVAKTEIMCEKCYDEIFTLAAHKLNEKIKMSSYLEKDSETQYLCDQDYPRIKVKTPPTFVYDFPKANVHREGTYEDALKGSDEVWEYLYKLQEKILVEEDDT